MVTRYERRFEKERLKKTSYMNNAKWEKLFKAVADSELSLHGESIKHLADEVIRPLT